IIMKTKLIFCLLLSILISGKLLAFHYYSSFNLKMSNNTKYSVIFDGITYDVPGRKFKIQNLRPGNHLLKVITYKRRCYHKHHHSKHKRHKCRTYADVIFNDYIWLKPNCDIYALIDKHRGYKVYKVRKRFLASNAGCIYGCTTACEHSDLYFDNAYHEVNSCSYTMDSYQFNELKRCMDNNWFDSSKKKIAIQAISTEYITALQLRQLLLLFDFEDSRLEFAKMALERVCDIENIYYIHDAFDSSINELNEIMTLKN
ncbi:DUF4476 domain-containing protein, partial [Candidatus Amoebophilus asiaticus]|nr:DUF4476 domain-containing protein [Candidatus Amoebophilus asiaticus]